jgi:hypothetical protein
MALQLKDKAWAKPRTNEAGAVIWGWRPVVLSGWVHWAVALELDVCVSVYYSAYLLLRVLIFIQDLAVGCHGRDETSGQAALWADTSLVRPAKTVHGHQGISPSGKVDLNGPSVSPQLSREIEGRVTHSLLNAQSTWSHLSWVCGRKT